MKVSESQTNLSNKGGNDDNRAAFTHVKLFYITKQTYKEVT